MVLSAALLQVCCYCLQSVVTSSDASPQLYSKVVVNAVDDVAAMAYRV